MPEILKMHSIWAVATNTVRQALRMKVAAVFIILLLVLLPFMGFTATGDGTLKGRLQTFVSYSVSLTALLLSLLSLIVSVYSVTSDIEQRQIYTVITKPVRRSQLLLGKLLGVVLLNLGLLAIFSAIIYTIAVYTPTFARATPEQLATLENEFFTARRILTPGDVDVTRDVNDAYRRLKQGGQLDELLAQSSKEEILAQLTKQMKLEKRAAAVGRPLVWEFANVKLLDPNDTIFVRFKYDVSVNPPDQQVYSRWIVGDLRQGQYGGEFRTPVYPFPRKDAVRTFHEIAVPADAVADDGYLGVGFLNVPPNNTVVIFPLEDGLSVQYKADTFAANFFRAALLIFCRLIFLACLGLLAATFLSFPVAMLLCMVVFLTATCSAFVIESFDYLSANMSLIYSFTVKLIVRLLPEFDKFNPSSFLVPAKLVSWSLLARCAALMVCIKALLLLVLALVIFSFREIAKIIV